MVEDVARDDTRASFAHHQKEGPFVFHQILCAFERLCVLSLSPSKNERIDLTASTTSAWLPSVLAPFFVLVGIDVTPSAVPTCKVAAALRRDEDDEQPCIQVELRLTAIGLGLNDKLDLVEDFLPLAQGHHLLSLVR